MGSLPHVFSSGLAASPMVIGGDRKRISGSADLSASEKANKSRLAFLPSTTQNCVDLKMIRFRQPQPFYRWRSARGQP